MNLAAPVPSDSSVATLDRRHTTAEAARYGVLRRLAPALKHDMVVNLQAVAMMAELLNARLEKGAPSLADFEASVSKMNRLAREGVMSCLKVAAWLEPAEDEAIRLCDGVDECIELLRSSFNFRGCTLSSEVPGADFDVSRVVLRNLLVASLISMVDSAGVPSDLVVCGAVSGGFAMVTVRCAVRSEGGPFDDPVPSGTGYRVLEWADVQALAAAESVELFRTQDQITMRIARLVANSPLQIAPS